MVGFCLVDTCLCKNHNLDVPIDKNHKREKANGTASGEKPREEILTGMWMQGIIFSGRV